MVKAQKLNHRLTCQITPVKGFPAIYVIELPSKTQSRYSKSHSLWKPFKLSLVLNVFHTNCGRIYRVLSDNMKRLWRFLGDHGHRQSKLTSVFFESFLPITYKQNTNIVDLIRYFQKAYYES